MDGLLDAIGLDRAPVIGHSLGGMSALWHAVARPGRIGSLAAIGAPATALPGATARMPLALMTLPVVGPAVLRSPAPRPVYRALFAQGMGAPAAAAAPGDLIEVLRLAARRPANAATTGALMYALNRFRHGRPGNVLTGAQLHGLTVPVLLCWGSGDRFSAPAAGRAGAALMPAADFREARGGHGPWLDDPAGCAGLVTGRLRATGFPPAPASG